MDGAIKINLAYIIFPIWFLSIAFFVFIGLNFDYISAITSKGAVRRIDIELRNGEIVTFRKKKGDSNFFDYKGNSYTFGFTTQRKKGLPYHRYQEGDAIPKNNSINEQYSSKKLNEELGLKIADLFDTKKGIDTQTILLVVIIIAVLFIGYMVIKGNGN